MFDKKRFFLVLVIAVILFGVYYFTDKQKKTGFEIDVKPDEIVIGTFNTKFLGDFDKSNNSKYGDYGSNIRTPDNTLLKKFNSVLSNFDIVGLQEIENEKAVENLVKYLNKNKTDKKYSFFLKDSKYSPQDTAIVWNENKVNLKFKGYFNKWFNVVYKDKDDYIRFSRTPIYCIFEKNGIEFMVISVHLKAKTGSGQKDNFRREKESDKLVEWIAYQQKKYNNPNVIILGDFNDTFDEHNLHLTDLDSLIKAHTQNKIRFLTDKLAGSKKNFTTYHKYDDGERKSFIDHIVVTQNLVDYYVPQTCSVYYHNQYKTFSDHNPVYAIFNFNKSE